MSSSAKPRLNAYARWLTVGIAAALAIKLPVAWIVYRERYEPRYFNFHILLAVIYIPVAFGLIWPVLIGIEAWVMRSVGQDRKWPAKAAVNLFILSGVGAIPCVLLERRQMVDIREVADAEALRRQQIQAQQAALVREAGAVIQADGITAFSEPLTGPQVDAVIRYLDAHSNNVLELQSASKHYRDPSSEGIMKHLSERRYCPPEVLDTIFENAVELQKGPAFPNKGDLSMVFYNLAWNPNVPVSVLIKMLDNADAGARRAAAANPRTPKAARIEYLRRAAVSRKIVERQEAAESPDCPQDVLKQLALDPLTSRFAASNPNLPLDLLQTLANSSDLATRNPGAGKSGSARKKAAVKRE
jgi:hypothetical protein